MKVKSADYIFDLFDKKIMRSTTFIFLYFESSFNIGIYKESFLESVEHNALLHSKISDSPEGEKWTAIQKMDADRIFREYQIDCPIDDFYCSSMESFYGTKEKYVDIRREGPLKSLVFKCSRSPQVMLVLCCHHSVSDTRGWLQVIKCLGEIYSEKSGKQAENITYYKVCKQQKVSLKDCFETNYQKGVDKNNAIKEEISRMIPFMKKEKTVYKITDMYINSIKGIEVEAVKENIARYGFTINDLLIFLSLQLNSKLDGTDNKIAMTSYRMDLRKYLKEECMLNNLSFEQLLIVNRGDLSDKQKVKQKIDESKNLFGAYGELMLYDELDLLPAHVVIELLEVGMTAKKEEMMKGITSTNIGEVSEYVKGFEGGLKDVFWIPAYFENEAILMSAMSFHGRMTISILSDGINKETNDKVKSELAEMLHDFTAGNKIGNSIGRTT